MAHPRSGSESEGRAFIKISKSYLAGLNSTDIWQVYFMPKRTGVDSILSKCPKKCLSADSGVLREGSHHGSIMEGHPSKVEASKKL